MGPWGFIAVVGIILLNNEDGKKFLKKAFRESIKAGYIAKEKVAALTEEATKGVQNTVSEVKYGMAKFGDDIESERKAEETKKKDEAV